MISVTPEELLNAARARQNELSAEREQCRRLIIRGHCIQLNRGWLHRMLKWLVGVADYNEADAEVHIKSLSSFDPLLWEYTGVCNETQDEIDCRRLQRVARCTKDKVILSFRQADMLGNHLARKDVA